MEISLHQVVCQLQCAWRPGAAILMGGATAGASCPPRITLISWSAESAAWESPAVKWKRSGLQKHQKAINTSVGVSGGKAEAQ